MNLYVELTQLTGCKFCEEEWWHDVGFDANNEDIHDIIKIECGKCDAAELRNTRAELVKRSSAWGERMKRAGHVDVPPELGVVKHLVAQLAGMAACTQLQYHFERDAHAVPLRARR